MLTVLRGWHAGDATASDAAEPAVPRPLLAALLLRLGGAPAALTEAEAVAAIGALADLGLRVTDGDGDDDNSGALAAAVQELLHALSSPPHGAAPGLSDVPPAALAALLRAVGALGAAPDFAFLAAAQRELRARLAEGGLGAARGVLLPSFCAFAGAAAGFGARLEQELLDGFLEAAEPHYERMGGESWIC